MVTEHKIVGFVLLCTISGRCTIILNCEIRIENTSYTGNSRNLQSRLKTLQIYVETGATDTQQQQFLGSVWIKILIHNNN